MPGGELVAVNHVGKEQVLSEKHTIRFVFHDFATLPHERGKCTKSSSSLCHGYKWQLEVYPGGNSQSSEDTVHLSQFLHCVSPTQEDCKVRTKYAFRIPSANYSIDSGEHVFCRESTGMGYNDFRLRSDVLDPSKGYLVDGNLTIEVDIQVYMEKLAAFRPKTTLPLDMIKLLESIKHSDVNFQVGAEKFSAHRLILEARAPELAAVAEDYSSDTLIHIQGVKPSTFRSLLRFVYADDAPKPEELQNEARELLDVTNRFGCKGLKLLAEAELVDSGITVDTAADLILIGDAKNCALLKEAAMDFFAANPAAVMSSSGWEKIAESAPILKELMEVLVNNKKRPTPVNSDEKDYKRMCVSTLRRRLDEMGLDVDGSKEMLISRLEQENNDDGSGSPSHGDN
jgi:speckle-type POZ protein